MKERKLFDAVACFILSMPPTKVALLLPAVFGLYVSEIRACTMTTIGSNINQVSLYEEMLQDSCFE